MLGERYGWVPPDDDDNRVVLADQAWVEEHLARRSVTELEILHGVLNNPEIAAKDSDFDLVICFFNSSFPT